MNTAELTHRDVAEFLRLGLLAGICDIPLIVRWADAVIEAEPAPHHAFADLCLSGSKRPDAVGALLTFVPGDPRSDLPYLMLLGHAKCLLDSGAMPADELLVALYGLSKRGDFPERIHWRLVTLEEDLERARHGHGDRVVMDREIASFLAEYAAFAPDIPKDPSPRS